MRISALAATTTPAKGTAIALCRSSLDGRSVVETFEADGDWTVPATVNGHWYGEVEPVTEEQLRREYGI